MHRLGTEHLFTERLEAPHVPASRPSGAKDRCKIKLRNIGYRLSIRSTIRTLTADFVAIDRLALMRPTPANRCRRSECRR